MGKIGLICEGGGTKAAYTAGVLECFLDNNIEFPYCAGISAGGICLLPFVSKQRERLRITGVDATSSKEAVGLYPLIHEGSVFGINSLYDFIEGVIPLDIEAFKDNNSELELGLYNIENGNVEYFNKNNYSGNVAKAACALLMLTHPVIINDKRYMDGGLVDMIPVFRALEQGCDKLIFISTKEEFYIRKPAPSWQLFFAKKIYKNEPYIAKDLEIRHENYKKQWSKIKQMQEEGKAIILRPSVDMNISRYTTDRGKLNKWFDLGRQDTINRLEEIKSFLK